MPLSQSKLVEDPSNNLFINTTGDEMKGDLKMNKYLIKDLGNPISDNDAVRKVYVYNLFVRLKSMIDLLETKYTNELKIVKDELESKIQKETSNVKVFRYEITDPIVLSPYIIFTSPELEMNFNTGNISVIQISALITHTNNIVDNTFFPIGSSANKDYISITYGVNNLILVIHKEIKKVKIVCHYVVDIFVNNSDNKKTNELRKRRETDILITDPLLIDIFNE